MASHLILCTPCVPQERAGIETCGPETQPVTGSFGMLSTMDTLEGAAVPQLACNDFFEHLLMRMCLRSRVRPCHVRFSFVRTLLERGDTPYL